MFILSRLKSSSASGNPVVSSVSELMRSLFFLLCPLSGAQQAAGQHGRSVLPGAGERSRPGEPGSGRESGPGAVREAGAGLGGREEAAGPEGRGDEGKGRGGARAAASGKGRSPASVKTVDG